MSTPSTRAPCSTETVGHSASDDRTGRGGRSLDDDSLVDGAPVRRGRRESSPFGIWEPLCHHLLAIHHVVESHPELQDDYREWRRLYPTFTSDQDEAS